MRKVRHLAKFFLPRLGSGVIVSDMAKHDVDLSLLFHALSDPTRRAMLERLARGPAPVSELAGPTGLRLPTVMRHLAVLEEAGLRMLRVYAHDAVRRCAWLEDLGVKDLWDWRDREGERMELYRSTLRQAARIHAIEPEAIRGALREQLQPPFDESLYGWEQEYFFREFAERFSAVGTAELAAVRDGRGLAELRAELASRPRRMVHRDFQSQNVIIRDGRAWLIDYQGLRAGLPEYDLASLLYDPYVQLPEGERRALLEYYGELTGGEGGFGRDARVLAGCACQRLMQALGAYGKLGVGDGKKAFLGHIPHALENLRGVLRESGLVPELLRVLELRTGAVEAAGGPPVAA